MKEELNEELWRYRNGFQGSCYACETVGETNIKLYEALVEYGEHAYYCSFKGCNCGLEAILKEFDSNGRV